MGRANEPAADPLRSRAAREAIRAGVLALALAACSGGDGEPADRASRAEPAGEAPLVPCDADLAVFGPEPNDHLGFALAGLGPDGRADWNGDGAPDVLAGSYQKLDVPVPSDATGGSVSLMLSPWTWETPRPRPKDRVLLRVDGEAGGRLGRSVAWIGDLDGDGRSDFCAGDVRGPREDGGWEQRGRVLVFLSGDEETGLADAAASARVSAARASLVVHGEAPGQRFGHSVAGVGDVDGDGTPDVLVGAPGSFTAAGYGGRAFVLSGARLLAARGSGEPIAAAPAAIWSRAGEEALDAFGYRVARLGAGAFAAGAPEITLDPGQGLSPEVALGVNGPGYVVIVDRDAGGGLRERVVRGEQTGEAFGFALGAADVDGDGALDLLVGSPGWSEAERPRTGRARAFGRADLEPLAEVRGDTPLAMLGWCVDGFGADPRADSGAGSHADTPAVSRAGDLWAVGELGFTRPPGEGPEGSCAGAVLERAAPGAGRMRVFAGLDVAAPRFTIVGERNGDSAGSAFAHLGDLDGRGGTDVVLSVFRWDEPPPRNDVGMVCIFCDPLQ